MSTPVAGTLSQAFSMGQVAGHHQASAGGCLTRMLVGAVPAIGWKCNTFPRLHAEGVVTCHDGKRLKSPQKKGSIAAHCIVRQCPSSNLTTTLKVVSPMDVILDCATLHPMVDRRHQHLPNQWIQPGGKNGCLRPNPKRPCCLKRMSESSV